MIYSKKNYFWSEEITSINLFVDMAPDLLGKAMHLTQSAANPRPDTKLNLNLRLFSSSHAHELIIHYLGLKILRQRKHVKVHK